MTAALRNIFDQLRAWWNESFPVAVPLPEVREIPERHVLFAQLEELRAGHACALAMRQAAIATLSKDLAEAETRVETIRQQIAEQHRADWLANSQASAEIERLQAMILEKVPISLGMFMEELDSELTRLRQMEATVIPSGSDRNYSLMKKTMRFQTNAGSIRRRVVALQAARSRAVVMQTENLTVTAILDEVYRLRRSLPAVVDEETRGPLAAAVLGL